MKIENVRLQEARERDLVMNSKLALQLETSKQTSSDLLEALTLLKGNEQTSAVISGNLNRQLGVTTTISKQLSVAVTSLGHTSNTASAVLAETVDRIDYLKVKIAITIEPLAIKDIDGKPVFSADSLRFVTEYNAGKIKSDEDYLRGVAIFREQAEKHYGIIRKLVFQNWYVVIILDDPASEPIWQPMDSEVVLFPDTLMRYEKDAGISAFTYAYLPYEMVGDRPSQPYSLLCFITYEIRPDRYAGFRKYSDLDGVIWKVGVRSRNDGVQLYGADLSTGFSRIFLGFSRNDFELKGNGEYHATMKIPKGFFRPRGSP